MRQVADNSDAQVLIIDDEAPNLKLLDKILRAHGYRHIDLIQHPEQAIAAYQARPADIILLDLQMPVKDGFTLLEEFHALQDPLLPPIVVLTAYQQKSYRLRALQAGARDFLTKPFDHIELLAQSLYENLLGNTGHSLSGINCFHRPASLFSGDLLLARVSPTHNHITVLLAEAIERPTTTDQRIIVYSDGLTEALNQEQVYFKHILNHITPSLCDSEQPMQIILDALTNHLQDTEHNDDICLAEIDIGLLTRKVSVDHDVATPAYRD